MASDVLGMDIKEPFGECPDWNASVLTWTEQVCNPQCLHFLCYWEQVLGDDLMCVLISHFRFSGLN